MSLLRKCPACNKYTLRKKCAKCSKETISAHYKFKKIKDVKEN